MKPPINRAEAPIKYTFVNCQIELWKVQNIRICTIAHVCISLNRKACQRWCIGWNFDNVICCVFLRWPIQFVHDIAECWLSWMALLFILKWHTLWLIVAMMMHWYQGQLPHHKYRSKTQWHCQWLMMIMVMMVNGDIWSAVGSTQLLKVVEGSFGAYSPLLSIMVMVMRRRTTLWWERWCQEELPRRNNIEGRGPRCRSSSSSNAWWI